LKAAGSSAKPICIVHRGENGARFLEGHRLGHQASRVQLARRHHAQQGLVLGDRHAAAADDLELVHDHKIDGNGEIASRAADGQADLKVSAALGEALDGVAAGHLDAQSIDGDLCAAAGQLAHRTPRVVRLLCVDDRRRPQLLGEFQFFGVNIDGDDIGAQCGGDLHRGQPKHHQSFALGCVITPP